MATKEFWARLVSEGLIEGDPTYYSTGQATPEEVTHAIEVAIAADRIAFVDAAFEEGIAQGDPTYWYQTPPEGDADLFAAVASGGSAGADEQGLEEGVSEGTEDESPSTTGVGGTGTGTTSILTSKDMKWFFDKATGTWMVGYKLPGSARWMIFEASGSDMDGIFGEGLRPTSYERIGLQELLQRDGMTFGGNIFEVTGTGTFEAAVERAVALALDDGTLPPWASNSPAVLDLLYIATTENKSDEWLYDQLAKLPEFQARFPGIETMLNLGLTIVEAVTGFLELEMGIKDMILRDGGDPDSVTPVMVGDLLAMGHSLTDVEHVFKIFDRMENNKGAMDAFNEVLVAQGLSPLDEEGMFEFLAGNAPDDLYRIWEEASLHQAAIDAGLDIGADAAIDLARRTEGLTSYGSAYEGLTTAAANMLRFRGEIDFDRFNINEQDLIDMSLGLAPSSGTSQADLSMSMERAFSSARATRERARVNPFKRFSDKGVPQAASLAGVRQESS